MTKITAIIPTLNEENHIADAIKSVNFADEIIVIDSFSSDRTIEIAEKMNVKIIKRTFDDFSSQKNFAITQAKHDWIYILDADERVTPEVELEILEAVKNPKDIVGFYVRRTFYFCGKRVNFSGFQRDKVVRLFLKEHCKYTGLVHEKISTKGRLVFFKHKIDHFSYRNYDHYISKMNHYARIRANELHKKGKKVTLYHVLIKPLARFFIHYIIRLGFLDGFTGFLVANTQAYGVLTRYIKLWLLNKNKSLIGINKNLEVDAVITWVDGNDPKHREKMSKYIKNKIFLNNKSVRTRFDQVSEIEFAVKSILKYAKFIRKIYIITDNQKPEFLKANKIAEKKYSTVSIVDHKDIFAEYSKYLPTFNSLSIETMLYKIPGLAENFIYFNDDFFLANETKLEDFIIDNKPILRGDWSLFYGDIWHKKLKLFFNKNFQKAKKPLYKHNKGLQKPAEILNFNKYFHTPHVPSVFIKSSLKEFYKINKELLINNIKFKFREPGQFVSHSLSNHLQIKKENYTHKKNSQLVYFQNYKKPLWWIKFKLRKIENNKDMLFLCMQSLDQCPEDKLDFIKKWLINKYD